MNEETRCNVCEALVGDSPHMPGQCIEVWKLRYESSSDALKEVIAEHTKQSEELDELRLAEGLQNPVYERLVGDRKSLEARVEALKDGVGYFKQQVWEIRQAAQGLYDSITDTGPTYFSPNMLDKHKALGFLLAASSPASSASPEGEAAA